MAATDGRRSRLALALFVVMLVAIAFARAQFASSTGIRISGDGADYEAVAAAMRLEGRAPFVYRPAVPLLVGAVSAGNLTLGFALACAAAMFLALYAAGSLAPDALAGYGVAALLFFNYQVLFAAANPARIDVVVLAIQLGFVALAMRDRPQRFFALLPLAALVKESLLLSLGALALIAFPRDAKNLARLGVSSVAFVALHLGVRALSNPTAHMPPYDGGVPAITAVQQMLASNLSARTPLDWFVAWGGLCLLALWLAFGADAKPRDTALPAAAGILLLFPLPLVTDVHRAWFELFAPLVMFALLPRLTTERGAVVYPALAAALVASIIPYATHFVAPDHLYLLILENRLTGPAYAALALSLAGAAAALTLWRGDAGQSPSSQSSG